MKRHLLTSAVIIFLLLAALPSSASVKENWTRVRSKNFTVVGNASESDLRKMATKLELFRYVISLYLPGAKISTPVPTTIVYFKDGYSFDPFKPLYKGKTKKNVAGYFRSGDDMNYIVLSKEVGASNALQVILHEYEHFVVHNSVPNAPPWLDEGLAEFYSTFEQQGELTVRIGIPIDWHLRTLRTRDLLPLRTLLTATRQSPYYNEDDKAGIFYAESWALVHYLMRSDGGKRRPQLTQFISRLSSGMPPEENFQQSFQTDLKTMEKELRTYISRFLVPAVDLDFKTLDFAKETQSAPLSEAEAHFYMGDLQARGNRLKEAEEHLQKSIALDSSLAPSKVALAVVRSRQNRPDEYKRLLQEAMKADAKYYLGPLYYAGALVQDGRYEEAIKYYKQAALLKPDAWRIQVGLAQAYIGLGQEGEASKAFSAALRLNPQNSSINRLYSYAALGMARGSLAAINANVYLQREGWRDDQTLYMVMVAHYGYRLSQRADEAARILEEAAGKGDTSAWPYPVIEYLRRKLTEEELLALATDNDKQTEAHAYIGMDLALKGEREAALVHLRWVRENGNRGFIEYPLALAQLNRLEGQVRSSDGAQ
jgi:tetratricopeptide (TPR) repeat protein